MTDVLIKEIIQWGVRSWKKGLSYRLKKQIGVKMKMVLHLASAKENYRYGLD